eukprot:m.148298 g.148298  ORF g.148298 m.148298 type:complete len:654 (+) comp13252_c1_seq1:215-2176(+)
MNTTTTASVQNNESTTKSMNGKRDYTSVAENNNKGASNNTSKLNGTSNDVGTHRAADEGTLPQKRRKEGEAGLYQDDHRLLSNNFLKETENTNDKKIDETNKRTTTSPTTKRDAADVVDGERKRFNNHYQSTQPAVSEKAVKNKSNDDDSPVPLSLSSAPLLMMVASQVLSNRHTRHDGSPMLERFLLPLDFESSMRSYLLTPPRQHSQRRKLEPRFFIETVYHRLQESLCKHNRLPQLVKAIETEFRCKFHPFQYEIAKKMKARAWNRPSQQRSRERKCAQLMCDHRFCKHKIEARNLTERTNSKEEEQALVKDDSENGINEIKEEGEKEYEKEHGRKQELTENPPNDGDSEQNQQKQKQKELEEQQREERKDAFEEENDAEGTQEKKYSQPSQRLKESLVTPEGEEEKRAKGVSNDDSNTGDFRNCSNLQQQQIAHGQTSRNKTKSTKKRRATMSKGSDAKASLLEKKLVKQQQLLHAQQKQLKEQQQQLLLLQYQQHHPFAPMPPRPFHLVASHHTPYSSTAEFHEEHLQQQQKDPVTLQPPFFYNPAPFLPPPFPNQRPSMPTSSPHAKGPQHPQTYQSQFYAPMMMSRNFAHGFRRPYPPFTSDKNMTTMFSPFPRVYPYPRRSVINPYMSSSCSENSPGRAATSFNK